MPRAGFKVADIAAPARTAKLRSTLPEDLGDLEPAAAFKKRLGKAFLKRVGRRYGESGIHLVRVDTNQGAVVWGVKADREDLVR
jgi:hypothetical protein